MQKHCYRSFFITFGLFFSYLLFSAPAVAQKESLKHNQIPLDLHFKRTEKPDIPSAYSNNLPEKTPENQKAFNYATKIAPDLMPFYPELFYQTRQYEGLFYLLSLDPKHAIPKAHQILYYPELLIANESVFQSMIQSNDSKLFNAWFQLIHDFLDDKNIIQAQADLTNQAQHQPSLLYALSVLSETRSFIQSDEKTLFPMLYQAFKDSNQSKGLIATYENFLLNPKPLSKNKKIKLLTELIQKTQSQDDFQSSILYANTLLRYDSQNQTALEIAYQAHYNENQFNQAIYYLKRFIQVNPNTFNQITYLKLLWTTEQWQALDGQLQMLKRTKAHLPSVWHFEKKLAQHFEDTDRLIKAELAIYRLDSSNSAQKKRIAQAYIQDALFKKEALLLASSIHSLKQSIEYFPTAQAYQMLAEFALSELKTQKAIAYYRQSYQLNPTLKDNLIDLLAHQLGQHSVSSPEFKNYFDQINALNPSHKIERSIYERLLSFSFDQSNQIDFSHFTRYYNQAAHNALAFNEPFSAENYLQNALSLNASHESSLLLMAQLKQDAHQFEDAWYYYYQLYQMKPKYYQATYLEIIRAYTQSMNQQQDPTLHARLTKLLREGLELAPQDPNLLLLWLENTASEDSDKNEPIKLLSSKNLNPNEQLRLAKQYVKKAQRAFYHDKNDKDALKLLENAYQLGNQDPEVLILLSTLYLKFDLSSSGQKLWDAFYAVADNIKATNWNQDRLTFFLLPSETEGYFKRLSDTKRFKQAHQIAHQWLSAIPENMNVSSMRSFANQFNQSGYLFSAMKLYELILQKSPSASTQDALLKLYLSMNEGQAAMDLMAEMKEISNHNRIEALLSIAYQDRHNHEKALIAIKQAQSIGLDQTMLDSWTDTQNLLTNDDWILFLTSMKLSENLSQVYIKNQIKSIQMNDENALPKALNSLLELHKKFQNVLISNAIATLYLKLERFPEAAHWANLSYMNDNSSSNLQALLLINKQIAFEAYHTGRPTLAALFIERALAQSPEDPLLLEKAGDIYFLKRNMITAYYYWQKALDYNNTSLALHQKLQRNNIISLYKPGHDIPSLIKKIQADFPISEMSLEIRLFMTQLYYEQGKITLQKGQLSESKHYLNEGLRFDENNFPILLLLSDISLKESQFPQALYLLQRARRASFEESQTQPINQQISQIYTSYSQSLFQDGQIDQSIAMGKQSLSFQPNKKSYQWMIELYEKLKQPKDAEYYRNRLKSHLSSQ